MSRSEALRLASWTLWCTRLACQRSIAWIHANWPPSGAQVELVTQFICNDSVVLVILNLDLSVSVQKKCLSKRQSGWMSANYCSALPHTHVLLPCEPLCIAIFLLWMLFRLGKFSAGDEYEKHGVRRVGQNPFLQCSVNPSAACP